MIELRDTNGCKHYLAPSAIARVSEAPPSAAWHGVRAIVRTFDGETLEVSDDAGSIVRAVQQAQEADDER